MIKKLLFFLLATVVSVVAWSVGVQAFRVLAAPKVVIPLDEEQNERVAYMVSEGQLASFSLVSAIGGEDREYTDPKTHVVYCYNTGGTTAVTKKGDGNMIAGSPDAYGDLVILDHFTVDGKEYTVTEISASSFVRCNLSSVEIPSTVNAIRYFAFDSTPIESIVIPEGVTSLEAAFGWCVNLKRVHIPSTLTSISEQPFGYSSMEEITVADGNPNYDSRDNCNAIIETATGKLISGSINTVIPEGVHYIGWGAFMNLEGLHEMNLPEGIYEIGSYAFRGTSLTEITLPKTLTKIGWEAFEYCPLTSVVIPENVTEIDGAAFAGISTLKTVTAEMEHPFVIQPSTFMSNGEFTSATLLVPEASVAEYKATTGWNQFKRIQAIGSSIGEDREFIDVATNVIYSYNTADNYATVKSGDSNTWTAGSPDAFGDITILESFEADGKQYIVNGVGAMAFMGNSSIGSVHIPETVSSIGKWAFYASSLTEVNIPENVTVIPQDAFRSTSLTSVYIPAKVKEIDPGAFHECGMLESVVVDPENSVYDSRENCNAIILSSEDELMKGFSCSTIPSGIKVIGESAFSGCEISSIVIPEGVEEIKSGAFFSSSLSSISLPSTLTLIEDQVFTYCSNLKYIDIPESVTEIGYRCFAESGVRTIKLPEGIDNIAVNMFSDCNSLVAVEIPQSMRTIGHEAFSGCKNLEFIVFPSELEQVNNSAFRGCEKLTKVVSKSELPFVLESTAFTESVYGNATLYVPEGSEELYSSTAPWSMFVETETITDQNDIDVEEVISRLITFEADGLVYEVQFSLNRNIVRVTQYNGSYNGEVVIPSEVSKDGVVYSVENIGRYALSWKSVRSVTLPSSLSSIDEYALAWNNLERIVSQLETPFPIPNSAFDGNYETAKLFVPEGCVDAYRNTEGWKNFKNIFAIGEITDFEADGIYYAVTSSDAKTVEVKRSEQGYSGDIVIPEEVTYNEVNYRVTSIGIEALCSYDIRSVTLPSSLSSIDEYALAWNNLERIVSQIETPFPIPNSAFDGNYETAKLFVPEGCVDAYRNTEGWKNFKNIFAIGDVTDFELDGLSFVVTSSQNKTVQVVRREDSYEGDLVIPSEVSYENVTYSVTSIGNQAFSNSEITSLTLPASLTSIEEWAFAGCYRLATVTSQIEEPFEIPYSAFEDIYDRASLRVPAGQREAYADTYPWNCFTTIVNDYEEFEYTDPETNVIYVYNKVNHTAYVKAGENWNAGCPDVSGDVTLLDHFTVEGEEYTVTAIGKMAFCNNRGITTMTIPATIVSIGQWAFGNIQSWNSIRLLAETPFEIPDDVFTEYCYWSIALQTPEGTEDLYATTPVWQNFFSYFDVDGVCYHVTSWEEQTAEVVKDHGDVIYSGNIKVSASVEHRGQTFTVTRIGEDAFSVRNVTEVELPATLTSIGNGAFYGTLLTEIVLPATLSTIGGNAFAQCSQLTTITLLNPQPFEISDWTFDRSTYMSATLILPEGSENAYKSTPGWRNFFTYFKEGGLSYHITSWTEPAVELVEGDYPSSVVVPASVEHAGQTYQVTGIGQYAFNYKVHEVTIPASVTTFDTYAFTFARNLGVIYSQIRNPFYFDIEIYNDGFYESTYLIVPEGCVENYRQTEGWSNFTHIYDAMPSSTSVTVKSTMATFASTLSLDFTTV